MLKINPDIKKIAKFATIHIVIPVAASAAFLYIEKKTNNDETK